MATVKGGDRMDKILAEIGVSLSKADRVNVGFLSGATYPDGTSVAMVAAVNEFGKPAIGQPPRPAFRNMIREKSPSWGSAVAGAVKAADYDSKKALALVGQGVKGQLQESIKKLQEPALKPVTVKRKGFSKPLIDTGHELNSVDYEVQ